MRELAVGVAGSSPQVRGRWQKQRVATVCGGLIPAGAGQIFVL
ncbi:hypothetical protein HMPREF0294_0589 [Corynebacterium glucuronolyticum ATCC 51867]|nr:hypothetical protein HMPREF0294_0589 [Corynebacterium glucuronolyticum ATCC 51867]